MNNVETPHKKPRCSYISKIGSRCHADPELGKRYCFFHDPDRKKKQAEARRQGGEARSQESETEIEIPLPPDLSAVPLRKASDVVELTLQAINQLRGGEIDLRTANAIGYLTSLLLRARKEDVQPVAELLAETINQLRSGEIDLGTAKAIGFLTSLLLRALKEAALEEQQASGETTSLGKKPRYTKPLNGHDLPQTILGASTPESCSPSVKEEKKVEPAQPDQASRSDRLEKAFQEMQGQEF